jgi:hypothetical protein
MVLGGDGPDVTVEDVLSPRQFGQLSEQLRKGGFTANIHTGEQPTSGYVVSDLQGERSRPLRSTRGRHIEAYAREHEAALTGPERYLGGWARRHVRPQEAVLDRSTRYPETALGHSRAYVGMVANRQESMYQVSNRDYPENPAYEKDPVKWMRRIQGRNVP